MTTATESRAADWVRLQPKWEKRIALAGVVLIALAAIAFPLINKYWPYRYRNVKPLLETVFASKITIDHYQRLYFPHPGFAAQGLTLRRSAEPDVPPIGSVEELEVEGNWLDLLMLRSRVRLVEVQGLHVVIPAVGSRANHADFPPGSSVDFAGPDTTVETLHMENTTLDILRDNGGRYTFPIRDLALRNLRNGQPMTYVVDMQNANPSGRIQARGSFGPLTPSNLGGTPLSGEFVFAPVNLGDIGTLHGTLSSKGQFQGRLADIETTATAATPDFSVDGGKPTNVSGSVQCTVNGLNGDVVLHTIAVQVGRTTLHAGGSVRGSPKTSEIDMDVENGRAEDLLRPFVHEQVPITGVVWLKAHAHIAPIGGGARFMQRLAVDGGFDVPAERLTKPETEKSLTAFSARAQGADADQGEAAADATDVVSSLKGQVKIRNGVLSSQRLTFEMPGASAELNGTFAFHTGAVHLAGDLKMDSDISHAATGFKSVLLKPLSPFFKRKKAGAVVPIAVTGVPHAYHVSQNMLHTK